MRQIEEEKNKLAYNKKNNITPKSIISKISDILAELNQNNEDEKSKNSQKIGKTIKQSIKELQLEMENAASNLEFEEAAKIRDEIKKLQQRELGLIVAPKENYKSKFKKK